MIIRPNFQSFANGRDHRQQLYLGQITALPLGTHCVTAGVDSDFETNCIFLIPNIYSGSHLDLGGGKSPGYWDLNEIPAWWHLLVCQHLNISHPGPISCLCSSSVCFQADRCSRGYETSPSSPSQRRRLRGGRLFLSIV